MKPPDAGRPQAQGTEVGAAFVSPPEHSDRFDFVNRLLLIDGPDIIDVYRREWESTPPPRQVGDRPVWILKFEDDTRVEFDAKCLDSLPCFRQKLMVAVNTRTEIDKADFDMVVSEIMRLAERVAP